MAVSGLIGPLDRRLRRRVLLIAGTLAAASIVLAALGGVFVARGAQCGVCHAMRPYAHAAARSGHPASRCGSCHATVGAGAIFADGSRFVRMVGGALTGRSPAPASVDERRCIRCHAEGLARVRQANGISVRHSDFAATRCSYCHGGVAHAVPGRFYKRAEMDDCLSCHRVGLSNVAGCELCHVPDADSRVSQAKTTWRVTHGPQWKDAHGLGDLGTCAACHRRDACAKCHGVQIPHPDGWKQTHGTGLDEQRRAQCEGCHARTWCEQCHGGVPMPHPAGFLKVHYADVQTYGYEKCLKCHVLTDCEACHVAGAHRSLPGISPHGRMRAP